MHWKKLEDNLFHTALFIFWNFRTCGGGGVSGVMLASRLCPSTSRRPTLESSSRSKNQHRNLKQTDFPSHQSDCVNTIQIRRRQISSKTCDLQTEYEDGNTRPPPSSLSSVATTLHRNSLIPSSLNSSPSVLTTNTSYQYDQSSDIEDDKKAFCNNCILTASTNKVESKKRLRLVHSTTR